MICLVRAPSPGGRAGAARGRLRAPLRASRPPAPPAVDRGAGRRRRRGSRPRARRPRRRSLERVTASIHCAASISLRPARSRRRARINTGGALRMLELSRELARARAPAPPPARLDRVRRRPLPRALPGDRPRRRAGLSQHLRAVEVRGRAGDRRGRRRAAAADRAAEHHRRRQPQRLDLGVQRHLLADARVLARADGRDRDRPATASSTSSPSTTSPRGVLALLRRRARAAAPSRSSPAPSAPTNAELIELACRQFGREPPRIVADPASRLQDADLYVPYFGIEASLDDTPRARAARSRSASRAPPLRDYFATLIGYAERARWGKVPVTREAAAAASGGREPQAAPRGAAAGCPRRPRRCRGDLPGGACAVQSGLYVSMQAMTDMRIDRLRQRAPRGPRAARSTARCATRSSRRSWRPGQRISENELAERLAVSRTPVREALIRLRDERFVQIVPAARHVRHADQHGRGRRRPVHPRVARVRGGAPRGDARRRRRRRRAARARAPPGRGLRARRPRALRRARRRVPRRDLRARRPLRRVGGRAARQGPPQPRPPAEPAAAALPRGDGRRARPGARGARRGRPRRRRGDAAPPPADGPVGAAGDPRAAPRVLRGRSGADGDRDRDAARPLRADAPDPRRSRPRPSASTRRRASAATATSPPGRRRRRSARRTRSTPTTCSSPATAATASRSRAASRRRP